MHHYHYNNHGSQNGMSSNFIIHYQSAAGLYQTEPWSSPVIICDILAHRGHDPKGVSHVSQWRTLTSTRSWFCAWISLTFPVSLLAYDNFLIASKILSPWSYFEERLVFAFGVENDMTYNNARWSQCEWIKPWADIIHGICARCGNHYISDMAQFLSANMSNFLWYCLILCLHLLKTSLGLTCLLNSSPVIHIYGFNWCQSAIFHYY